MANRSIDMNSKNIWTTYEPNETQSQIHRQKRPSVQNVFEVISCIEYLYLFT